MPDHETPIFFSLISDLQQARANAETQAERLSRLVADLEALHEPDANGDCPTCVTEAPCLTLRLLHGELSYGEACDAVREQGIIDLAAAETGRRPVVPTLAELLAVPTRAVDRAFEALIGRDIGEGSGRAGSAA